jgi:hypothetical protein
VEPRHEALEIGVDDQEEERRRVRLQPRGEVAGELVGDAVVGDTLGNEPLDTYRSHS